MPHSLCSPQEALLDGIAAEATATSVEVSRRLSAAAKPNGHVQNDAFPRRNFFDGRAALLFHISQVGIKRHHYYTTSRCH